MADAAETLQAVIDANPQGVFALDRELRYTAFDRAHAESMRRLYGAEIALGGRLTGYQTVADDREGALSCVTRALGGESVVLTTFSGEGESRRSFEIVHTPQTDASGAVIGVVVRAHEVTERREAEAALSDSEARYKQLFEAESDAVLLIDNESGRVLEANGAAAAMYGFPREELLGLTDMDLTAEPEPTLALTRGGPFELGEAVTIPLRLHRRRDGSEFPVEIAGRFFTLQGRTVRIATIRDISERRRADELLHRMIALRDVAEEVGRVASWAWDVQSGKATWSPEMYRLFDVDESEFDGDVIPILEARVHPDDQAALEDATARSAQGDVSPVEYRVIWRDGSEHVLHGEGRMQKDAEGRVATIVGYQDVTELRRREVALATSELYFRRFFDQSPIAAAVVALDHRFLRVNAAMERFTGYSAEELAEMTFLDLTRPEERGSDAELVAKLDRGESQEFTREKRYVRKDGSEAWGLLSVRVARDEAGEALFHLPVIVDITDRRRAQDELQHFSEELEDRVLARTAELEASNEELEAFIYSVSHDLRAPLRAIDGFSQMVVDDASDKLSDDDLEHLGRVRAGAQRMAVLIDGLLDLSRASRRDMRIERVDVSDIAASVLRELRAAEPGREVDTLVAPGMVATADATLLRDILANLLGNAWKFTEDSSEQTRIEVGVADADGERAFYVRDDGAGFDSAYATHLFGAFQRMHQAGQFEGDGIGLATVKRLVTRMGGRVWAEAEVEKGATFSFTLPEVRRRILKKRAAGLDNAVGENVNYWTKVGEAVRRVQSPRPLRVVRGVVAGRGCAAP